jgi:hypothetical protein
MHPVDPSLITDGSTFINPLGLGFTLAMCFLLLVLPRKYALFPILALVCYMTMGMRVMVGDLNFTMIRILLLFGWARLILRGEFRKIKLNSLDKVVIATCISGLIAYCLLWQTGDALKYRLGEAYNELGMYFFFRMLLRDEADVVQALKLASIAVLPLAAAMFLESRTGHNPFAIFGGVPELTFVRDDRLRCEGPFAHPILAGTFGSSIMPLFVGLWLYLGKKRTWVIPAIIGSGIIMFTSASSGPLLTFMMGLMAFAFWPLRKSMRKVRWAIVGVLAALQLIMKAPVWYLLARVDVVAGSTGYHRAVLIDRALANLPDWWLVGTKSTEAWASKDDHLFDVTNAYILAGANGGLLTMILFTATIVLAFKAVGRTIRLGEIDRPGSNSLRLVWALGAALLVHTASYVSVSYFDQNFVNWYMLLAFVATLCGDSLLMRRPEFLAKVNPEQSDARPFAPALGAASTNAAAGPAPLASGTTLAGDSSSGRRYSVSSPDSNDADPIFDRPGFRSAKSSDSVQELLPKRALPGTATK